MKVELKNMGTVNKNMVKVGDLSLFFSYETIVAFKMAHKPIKILDLHFSGTTTKFTNQLKADYIDVVELESKEFETALSKVLGGLK